MSNAERSATIARSRRGDFVRRTNAASANGKAMVRKMTVRCGQPYGWKGCSGLIAMCVVVAAILSRNLCAWYRRFYTKHLAPRKIDNQLSESPRGYRA